MSTVEESGKTSICLSESDSYIEEACYRITPQWLKKLFYNKAYTNCWDCVHVERFSKDVVESGKGCNQGRGILLPNAGRARASEGNTWFQS